MLQIHAVIVKHVLKEPAHADRVSYHAMIIAAAQQTTVKTLSVAKIQPKDSKRILTFIKTVHKTDYIYIKVKLLLSN